MKVFAGSLAIVLLLSASFAYADKLAPTQNTLQPLPPDVQPAASENVQRTATPADIQTVQNVQMAEQNAGAEQQNGALVPSVPFAPASSSGSIVLWIALVIAMIVAGGLAWLWRSF